MEGKGHVLYWYCRVRNALSWRKADVEMLFVPLERAGERGLSKIATTLILLGVSVVLVLVVVGILWEPIRRLAEKVAGDIDSVTSEGFAR